MPQAIQALILDDDENASALLEFHLSERFPEIKISTSSSPTPLPGYDIYFVDNDFNGEAHIIEVVSQLRRQNPESLCVAFSACLERGTLKQLVNAGCDHVCEKGFQRDLDRTLDLVEDFIRKQSSSRKEVGVMSTIHSIADLFREWNRRMENSRARI